MAIAQVTTTAPFVGAVGRAWALAWPWAAWASLLRPTRIWTEAFVLLSAWSQSPLRCRAGQLGRSVRRRVSGLRPSRQPVSPDDDPRYRPVRRRWYPTPRQAFRAFVWTTVVGSVGLFAATLAVPAWYGLHGQRLLIVTSGSMSPFVEAGDVAVLQAIDDPSQLRVGQVVTFWPPGSKHLVTHRIVDLKMQAVLEESQGGQMVPKLDAGGQPIMRPYVFTKGDANDYPDPDATPLSLVSGVVVSALPGWGLLLGWVQSPLGKLAFLAPPLVLLAALEVVDALAERRHRPALRPFRRPEVIDALGTA